jgi:hypothetical protein
MLTKELDLPTFRLWALAVLGDCLGASVAEAQFPDVLSDAECPGCRAALENTPSVFTGVWTTPLTAADDPAWAIEDFVCFAACTVEARAHAARLLRDPANARRTILELLPMAVAANAQHATAHAVHHRPHADTFTAPGFACDAHGFASQVLSHLPLEIEQHVDRVALRYEELGASRTVFLSEHAAPTETTPFGVSRGRIDDRTLIVETSDIPAGHFHAWFGGGPHSSRLRAVETYAVSDDGRWLDLTLELHDPETLREPLVVTKRWRRAPGARLASHYCDIMSGQLGPVFAEYVDPRKIDARRRAEITTH